MVLACPSSDKGKRDTASFSHTKAYDQSLFMSASSTSLQAASSGVGKEAWQECTHTAVRPNTLSHLMTMLGAINKNAMSCLDFSMFPHDPTMERAVSCACMIAHMWMVVNIGQKSCNPHIALVPRDPYLQKEPQNHS